MTTIDLTSPTVRVQLGLWNDETFIETSHLPEYHRPRHATCELIERVVMQANKPLTRLEIARACRRKKSTYFASIIEGMVADGLLSRTHRYQPNGVICFLYAPGRGKV